MTIVIVSSYERFLTFSKRSLKENNSAFLPEFNLSTSVLRIGPLKFVWIPIHNVQRAYSIEASGVMFIEDDTWAKLPMNELGGLCQRIREYDYNTAER